MLKAAQDVGEELAEIVILGDYADFYFVNSHGKHPLMFQTTKEEIDAVNKCLDELDTLFPDVKKVYLEGNHEYRLERFLCNKAPELFGMSDWKDLFKLRERPNWITVNYGAGQYYRVLGTDLYARHEPISMGGAKASLGRGPFNLVYGHTHRADEAMARRPDGKPVVHFSPGWLGDFRKDKVFGFVKSQPNWRQGFAWVYTENRSYDFKYQIVSAEGRSFLTNGKLYK